MYLIFKKKLQELLNELLGFKYFREHQTEMVHRDGQFLKLLKIYGKKISFFFETS